jgi:hypothetical protein
MLSDFLSLRGAIGFEVMRNLLAQYTCPSTSRREASGYFFVSTNRRER